MSLYKLIESLSSAEKRHFTLHNSESKKYVRLYKEILNQKVEDNTYLDEIGFNATDRNTLYKKIMESLTFLRFHKIENIDSYLKFLIDNFSEMFNRGLLVDLERQIIKAKQLAYKNDKFLSLLEILKAEKQLLSRTKNNYAFEKFNELVKEERNVQAYLKQDIDYFNLRNQVYLLRKKDVRLINPKNKQLFEFYSNSELVKSGTILNSIFSKISYYSLKSIFATYQQEPNKAIKYVDLLVKIFEINPRYAKDQFEEYKNALNLAAEVYIQFGNHKYLEEILDKMESLDGNDDEIFNSISSTGLVYTIQNVNKQLGERYIHIFEKMYAKNNEVFRPGRTLAFFYNISVFKCLFGEWKAANEWFNKIIDFKRTDERKDLQYATRILKCMIGIEYDGLDLDNHLQAISKYFKKHKQDSSINLNVIKFFKKINKSSLNKREPIIQEFDTYLKIILAESERIDSQFQLGIAELELWTASKLEKTTIGKIMLKRNRS